MFSELHQVLLGCGYQYTKAQHIPEGTPLCLINPSKGFYVKSYETTGGEFSIALSLPSDPHITLPSAYILKKPDQYKNKLLPHVNLGWHLCYVRELEADWDSNNLNELYLQVDSQIQRTLDASVNSADQGSVDDQEMEGEFSSYWLPRKRLYLLSDASEKLEMQCYVTLNESGLANPGKATGEEWVAYEKEDEIEFNQWLKQRHLTKQDGRTILTSYFKINPSRLAGVEWPPQDLRALLQWLTEVDLSARSRLLDHFVNNPVKRHVLLFDVRNQDLVGLFVELDIAATGLNTYPKKNNRKKHTGRVVKSKTLIPCLSAKHSVHKFTRIGITRADKKTILSRNRRRSATGDLGSKRIALIGCGTIGGYLCGLLLRSGAGCGGVKFDLYDDDSFGPQNFGRHPLSTMDFGQNKATALAATLRSSTHLNCQVEGKPSKFPITPELLSQYDVIIDTTGRPPVAKRLAHVVRTIPDNKRPTIIHGFNDGNGRSSKVMIDDGSCCYGCMLADPAFYKNDLDLRFIKIDSNEERFISCGSTFTPYDAAVSVITAAMAQEAVLSILEQSPSWTYSEHMLDGSRSKQSRLLPRQPNCPICHD
ncbi:MULTISPECIES: E2/UBC family protein [unclassified Pseudomonas]|uniref:E2/UBC family protein n=1 Tax=unclassified Pseudomonas TaxID=196821 RepID=UPI00244CE29D|nr:MULTISPECIES: E2/UBC family protein [unclassified Pseudomonas]MDG9928013.1 ThiF family adenylyltransferase [Pseudomonas sp. GD04042]MDH0482022.1 ThiF family adenylyltransferase [Pseudomonas sp. GD04015]MDH0604083.1 ThiF family adenylyltransferase [Pseudomonas sp. GD03869]